MSNESSNKRIAKNTAFLYVRMLATLFVGLYTSRIVLRELGIVDYGLQNVVGSLLSLFTFINGSLSSSASRFLAFEIGKGEKGNLNKIFCMTQNIHFIFAALVFLFAETIGLWYLLNQMVIPSDRIGACIVVYQLSIVSAILSILTVPYNAMIIAQEKMKAFAYLSITNVFAKLLIAYALCVTSVDKLITSAILTFIVSLIIRMLYIRYCITHFSEAKYSFVWDKRIFKDMLSFSGWSVCSYTTIVVNQASNLLINVFFGPTINAARAVAGAVQENIYAFASNFQVALNPQIVKNTSAGESARVYELVELSQKISFSLLFLLLLPILVNIEFILSIWLVEVPAYSEQMLIMVCITSVFTAMGNPLGVIAEANNQLKLWNLTLMPMWALSLLMAWLVLRCGASAVTMFAVFMIFEFFTFFLKIFVANRIARLPMVTIIIRYLKVTISIALATLLGYKLQQHLESGITTFLITSTVVETTAIAWLAVVILNRKERKAVVELVKKKLGLCSR